MQTCRLCGLSQLTEILDLGFAPPSNALLSKDDLSKGEVHYPLVLLFCQDCKLIQTRDFHSSGALFTPDYPYLSSTSTTWLKHSHDLVESLVNEFELGHKSLVAEIASNDGYLLERLVKKGIPNYGIEPTKLAADISINKGHNVYNCFLTNETASVIRMEQGAADVVIANNVFAHVPDLAEFTKAAKLLLSENGVLVIEVQYFAELLANNLFDTIYHEHYSYFTISSMKNLLSKYGLSIFRIDPIATHGGSIRVYARRKSTNPSLSVSNSLDPQWEERATNLPGLLSFQVSVNAIKKQIKEFFADQARGRKLIAGVGAAAKGNTLINFLGLGVDDIRFVFDSAKSKQGKFLPGSHIPIYPLSPADGLSPVDLFVILPWNISTELAYEVRESGFNKQPIYRLLPKIERI